MIFLLGLLLSGPRAEAHLLGTSPWCTANSPTHYECFFYDRETCDKAATRRTTSFERWECLGYPPNFADFPKVGEATPTPTPTPSPTPTPRSPPPRPRK
ncbi:MAG: hypothetical protein KF767_10010 [Bdellovibrionaceae bacterium]|nr:hypothetical protein [Pseudobdellovibrionaceae bacterium]